jgi:glycerophosphoryl diester phosphodiesterase
LILLLAALAGPATARDLQGHCGARAPAPGNTLAGCATTLGLGVTMLQLDTAITRNGVVVVSHDPVLKPMITRGPERKRQSSA